MAVAAAALTSCATVQRPVSDGGDYTLALTKYVRCEVRDELVTAVLDLIEALGDRSQKAMVAELKAIRRKDEPAFDRRFRNLRYAEIPPLAEERIRELIETNISYAFTLNMKTRRSAKLSLGAASTDLAANYTVRSGTGPAVDSEAEIKFTIADTFSHYRTMDCTGLSARAAQGTYERGRRDAVYPMNGTSGMGRIVRTYLALRSEVAAENRTSEALEGSVREPKSTFSNYTDKVRFTTDLSLGLDPSVTFSPLPGRFALSSLSVELMASRTEFHEVFVTILPFKKPAPKVGEQFKLSDGVTLTVRVPEPLARARAAARRTKGRREAPRRVARSRPRTTRKSEFVGASDVSQERVEATREEADRLLRERSFLDATESGRAVIAPRF